jgi:hypothetical protein
MLKATGDIFFYRHKILCKRTSLIKTQEEGRILKDSLPKAQRRVPSDISSGCKAKEGQKMDSNKVTFINDMCKVCTLILYSYMYSNILYVFYIRYGKFVVC